MNTSLFWHSFLFCICLQSLATAQPLQVLYVTGGGHHDYTTQEIILREGLSKRANIKWTTWKGEKTKAGVPKLYLTEDWAAGFDVVIHNGCMEDIADGAEKTVAEIVKEHQDAKVGVVAIHCAMHTYRKDQSGEWEKLTGIHSVRHGPHFPYIVRKLRDHPILAGVPDEWETPKGELYHTTPIKNTMPLCDGYKKDDPKVPRQVNVWVSNHGSMRTFGTTIGHHNETMEVPTYLDIVARGMLWSADKLNDDGTPKAGYGPKRSARNKRAPTHVNVPYGDHERQVLDFWRAAHAEQPAPVFVWIHGGGFRAGNKSSIPTDLLDGCLNNGISVASIHYRLSSHAPYPAQMHDSARAIQFIRSKAGDWNIDPKRVAAGGGSAGSGISQWLAFHDDMANPKSSDPVARQSTRLVCALPINMQSTYDPREIKTLIPGNAYKHRALIQLFDLPSDWNWDTAKVDADLDRLLRDASPISHLTKDDAPAFLIHYERSNKPGNIHHSNFGKHLKQAMDKLDIECVRRMDRDYESMAEAYADMVRFLQKHFQ